MNKKVPATNGEVLGKTYDLSIEFLASSGSGVGFLIFDTKRAVFVKNTAPGDLVRARIITQKKVYYEAELLEILVPSPKRIPPPCKHYGACGACDWLHVAYDEQARQKERLLRHAFAKQKITLPIIMVIPADEQYHYRCKLRFPGNGFSARKSNTIIPVTECHLMRPEFQSMLSQPHEKGECWGFDEKTGTITQGVATYSAGEQKLAYDPRGFVQANFGMNRKLIAHVVKAAGSGRILELYAGNGNFTLSLAEHGEITAIEGDPKSYELLKKNSASSSTGRITTIHKDVHQFLKLHKRRYDCVVLDPPRTGIGEEITSIAALTDHVVYVSCNADALAKDARTLLGKGFTIISATLLDLFPQTRHYETVLVLQRAATATNNTNKL